MDIVAIFQQIFQWSVPALIGGIALVLLFVAGYLIYKKRLSRRKGFSQSAGHKRFSAMLLVYPRARVYLAEPWRELYRFVQYRFFQRLYQRMESLVSQRIAADSLQYAHVRPAGVSVAVVMEKSGKSLGCVGGFIRADRFP